jgi:hypothetical protein
MLGIACVSLILRGDEGCVTEDRSVEGAITIGIATKWVTEGFTDTGDSGNLGQYADEILDALGDVSTDEIQAALDAGEQVTIAGATGRVTRSDGHDAARAVTVQVNVPKAPTTILRMRIPDNQAGMEVNASENDDTSQKYLILEGDGVNELARGMTSFLQAYLNQGEAAARTVLDGILWSATWTSTPPPSESSQDDFEWEAELLVNIPVVYEVTTPNF